MLVFAALLIVAAMLATHYFFLNALTGAVFVGFVWLGAALACAMVAVAIVLKSDAQPQRRKR